MRCVVSPHRIRWAQLRAGESLPARTMDEARILTDRAEVPLAPLYLSDPGAVGMIAAWLHGAIKARRVKRA
jgi:hypothetical protein